ncbi:MAG: hypothetical protein GY918_04845 [Gammaproteobacteria bacterium]|nr:hypothetical protein [Gammaproteobacteria bacterium]
MITFENGIDIRSRQPRRATVARFNLGAQYQADADKYMYCIIGTDYGHVHTSGGEVRLWETYSGAMRISG